MASFYSLSVSLLLATTLLADPGSKNDRLVFTQNKIKADAGDANSQIYIGIAYGMGMGVPQDDVESTKWFLKAALQGNEMAIGLMGNTYETGKGVPIDKVEALRRVMEPHFADLLTRCGCAATAWQKLRALTGAAATTL
jgi:TPR repeat protein